MDSASVFFQNWQNLDDVLDVTLTDEQGWLLEPTTFSVTLEDSVGASALIKFDVQADLSMRSTNKVNDLHYLIKDRFRFLFSIDRIEDSLFFVVVD